MAREGFLEVGVGVDAEETGGSGLPWGRLEARGHYECLGHQCVHMGSCCLVAEQ